ncbi:MAG: preprotein translocase subunit SecE [Oscillospiraceae bacterium]
MAEAKRFGAVIAFFKKIAKFFRDCKGEVKKIVWPTPQVVFKNTGIVLLTILIAGLFIFLLDTVFMQVLSLVMNVAK